MLAKSSWVNYNNTYSTMMPIHFSASDGCADIWNMGNGSLNLWQEAIWNYSVRPVINLKSDVKITGGIGTSNDPYIIDTSK